MEELGIIAAVFGAATAVIGLGQILTPVLQSSLLRWRTKHMEDTVRELTLRIEGKVYKIDIDALAEQGPETIDRARAAVRQDVRKAA